ncbi:DNA binding protein [Stemphylium lycopersici]|nr:hypothetical protein TW65_06473 [Stemphylium lycopersici]RAR04844.1 DNA binding protein [Stemphylium lycopersici]
MPRDAWGQPHTGSQGLFDDVDETARSTARAEAKEIKALQTQIRRQLRRDRHQEYKEAKIARRIAAGKPPESRMSELLERVFGARRKGDGGSLNAEEEAMRRIEAEKLEEGEEGGVWEGNRSSGRARISYSIVRISKMPDPAYRDNDVQPVDSPWLRECGMVKVKSSNPGGCHIVSKTIIQREEGFEDLGVVTGGKRLEGVVQSVPVTVQGNGWHEGLSHPPHTSNPVLNHLHHSSWIWDTVMRPFLRPPWLRQFSLLAWLPPTSPHRVPRRIATTSTQNTAPIELPKLILPPGSQHHNSLPTFIEYAKHRNLAPETSLYIGTHYEYTSALSLMRLGFSLLRIGRRDDAGIDLIGHWVLAPLREPLPVIIQCKARKITVNPQHIRELEGSFQGIPPDWRNKDVLGLLVTTMKATKGVMEALSRSRWPMGFVLVSKEGLIQQFVWNRAATERGLEGVGVTVRHTPRALLSDAEHEADEEECPKKKKTAAKFKNAGTRRDIQLTWMGSPIFPERKKLDLETINLMHHISPKDDKDPAVVGVERNTRVRSLPSKPNSIVGTAETTVPKRARGRPKATKAEVAAAAAEPRRTRGRPKIIKAETVAEPTTEAVPTKRRAGRPVGSKSKVPIPEAEKGQPKPRGRPKGSIKPWAGKMPSPRGGQIPTVLKSHVGRPKGAKNKPKVPS